jgi:hypothetical protein
MCYGRRTLLDRICTRYGFLNPLEWRVWVCVFFASVFFLAAAAIVFGRRYDAFRLLSCVLNSFTNMGNEKRFCLVLR